MQSTLPWWVFCGVVFRGSINTKFRKIYICETLMVLDCCGDLSSEYREWGCCKFYKKATLAVFVVFDYI